MAKRKRNVEVSFVDSESAEDVTGSNVYVKTQHHNILLDCGMHQTNNRYKDFLVNNRQPKEYKVRNIDMIFVLHNHIDHIGNLPLMFKRGCTAQVLTPSKNKDIMQLMLSDCANINERDIQVINAQNHRNYEPLYVLDDVKKTMEYVKEYQPNVKYKIDDEISFKFIPSGHLLGACQLKLYITDNNVTKTLLYTSDLGSNILNNPFVDKFETVEKADCVIGESTYGDKPKQKNTQKERNSDLDKLTTIIDTQVKEMNGRVIIPTFAQSRCQELAYFIWKLYKDKEWQPKVYVDSPLAINIFKTYQNLLTDDEKKEFDEMLKWKNLVFINDAEDSISLVQSSEPCVVLATSGMCTVGRVRHHLKANIGNVNSTILFVGYSTQDSLASLLKDPKTKAVTIDQKSYKCRCSVYNLKSLSGHAMYKQLLDYYSSINCQKIVLHHGSKTAKEYLGKTLKQRLEEECKTTKVVCANKSLKFSL